MSTKKFVEIVNRGRCAIYLGLFDKMYQGNRIEEVSVKISRKKDLCIQYYRFVSSHLKVRLNGVGIQFINFDQ